MKKSGEVHVSEKGREVVAAPEKALAAAVVSTVLEQVMAAAKSRHRKGSWQ